MPTKLIITAEMKRQVIAYVNKQGYITNQKWRKLTGLSYDQAIYFFNSMVESGELLRVGTAGGTRYVLPK